MQEEIKVPDYVVDAVQACRDSGELNMFDAKGVVHWCYDNGSYSAVNWFMEGSQLNSNRVTINYTRYSAAMDALGKRVQEGTA